MDVGRRFSNWVAPTGPELPAPGLWIRPALASLSADSSPPALWSVCFSFCCLLWFVLQNVCADFYKSRCAFPLHLPLAGLVPTTPVLFLYDTPDQVCDENKTSVCHTLCCFSHPWSGGGSPALPGAREKVHTCALFVSGCSQRGERGKRLPPVSAGRWDLRPRGSVLRVFTFVPGSFCSGTVRAWPACSCLSSEAGGPSEVWAGKRETEAGEDTCISRCHDQADLPQPNGCGLLAGWGPEVRRPEHGLVLWTARGRPAAPGDPGVAASTPPRALRVPPAPPCRTLSWCPAPPPSPAGPLSSRPGHVKQKRGGNLHLEVRPKTDTRLFGRRG